MKLPMSVVGLVFVLLAGAPAAGRQGARQAPPAAERTFAEPAAYVPDVTRLAATTSELRDLVDRFALDRQALHRFYPIAGSNERRARLRAFQQAWLDALPKIDFVELSREGQVDYVLLRNHLEYSLALLDREERRERDTDPLLPFEEDVIRLQEERQKLRFVSPQQAVTALTMIGERIKEARAAVEAGMSGAAAGGPAVKPTPLAGQRAAAQAERLLGALEQWFEFYNGYDPAFTSAVPPAYNGVTQALGEYA
ncbi:MAG: hypothetical protein ACRD1U_17570, partial [Vicinamibacterales bacterium]